MFHNLGLNMLQILLESMENSVCYIIIMRFLIDHCSPNFMQFSIYSCQDMKKFIGKEYVNTYENET